MMSDKTMLSLFQEEGVEVVFLLLLVVVQEVTALSVSVAYGASMVVTKTVIEEMKSPVPNLNLFLPSYSVPHSHMCPAMQHCSLLTLSPNTVLQTIPC